MSQEGSIATRQSTRMVTAIRKQAMAEERARILGRRWTHPSALEEAAAQLKGEQEARARKAEEERREFSRQRQALPFSLQQVSIRHKGIEANGEAGWKVLVSTQDSGTRMAHGVNRRGVGALFRRLMAIERARILSRKPLFNLPRSGGSLGRSLAGSVIYARSSKWSVFTCTES